MYFYFFCFLSGGWLGVFRVWELSFLLFWFLVVVLELVNVE